MLPIKSDSRNVKPGDTFVALPGVYGDGHQYISQAIENGAVKIVAEHGEYDVETLIVPDTRAWLTEYLDEQYGKYINEMTMACVTGTNGKTTTVFELYDALNKLGCPCAYIGTIGYYDKNGKVCSVYNTLPDLCDVYDYLMTAYNEGCRFAAMEASSHGLAYGRNGNLTYDYTIFTNLTQDHLDFHGTMEKYALTKQKLFKKLRAGGTAIVNTDNFYSPYFLLPENKNVSFGFNSGDWRVSEFAMDVDGCDFTVQHGGEEHRFRTPLLGEYNVYNLLPVIIILHDRGYSFEQITDVVARLSEPAGRMDTVRWGTNKIIVDYAHTPDGFLQLLTTINRVRKGKVYVVFGGRGSRDRDKRPKMTKIACEMTDRFILTASHLFRESLDQIIGDYCAGGVYPNMEIIRDRREAMRKGISMLDENDILLILGKGHEEYLDMGFGEKIHFDDKEVVYELLKEFPER